MKNPTPASLSTSMKSFSRAASILTLLVGSLVLLGWILNIAILKSILPGLATMKANTALAFMLTGLGLLLILRENATRRTHFIIQGSALLIAILGLLTLCEYIFHWQLGIDQWLIKDMGGGASNLIPGRMSPVTALNFLLIGGALLFLDRGTPVGDRLAQYLALLIALFSGISLLGYAYGEAALYGIGAYNQIAIHTALTFILITAALMCARPDSALMATITSENAGSFMARRILPAAIILPIILGWIRLQGQRAGFYDTELGLALMVSVTIVVFVFLVGSNARLLNQTDAELKLALATDLRQSEERLRYVLWATRDAVWDRNIPGGEIWWNDGPQKLFHYRADEVESSVTWWETHIHPEDRERVIRSIQHVIETRQNLWSKEYRFQQADGTYANAFDRGYIIYDEKSGQAQRMIGAMADITEQKNIEKALRQSEELFAKAFSASPAGVSLTRISDGHFVEVNDAYLKLVEYSRREILASTTLELGIISAEDRARLLKIFNEQGTVRDFEYWMHMKSGQVKAVLSSLEQVEIDGTACFLSLSYDITARKNAEAAQQQSEALFRTLFELSPDAVVVIDPHDTNVSWPIIDCNAAACQMNGYDRDELIGHSIDILNGASGTRAERSVYMKSLRKTGIIKAEFQHRRKSGAMFPVETATTLITIGERELILGIDRDITERKQAEAALQQSEEKFRKLFEILPVGVSMIDERKAVVDMNPALQRMLKISKEGLATGAYDQRKYLHRDNTPLAPEEFPSFRTTEEQQTVQDVEICVVMEDGENIWTNVSAAPLPFADIRAVIVTTDITARIQAEQALAHEQYLLQALLENAPDHIYFKDAESRFTRISSAQARLFGLSDPAQVIGKTDFDFFTEEHARPAYEDEQEIIRTGQPQTREERETWPDRPDTWAIATRMPLRNQQGEIIGTFGISKDITRRKQAEDALHDTNENLSRGLAELDQRNHEIVLLNELSNLLQTCQTADEAYAIIGQSVPVIFPNARGAIYMINASQNMAEAVAAWKLLSTAEQAFAPKNCMALRRGKVHFLTGEHTGTQCKHVVGSPASSICVPLRVQDELLGVFHLQSMQDKNEMPGNTKDWKSIEHGLAETVADTIALALTNLQLRETLRNQAIRDPLTNLFNRRFMEESLERELHRAIRNKSPLGIIMLDLDHFKDFNDTYGHDAGDTVLREFSKSIKNHIRAADIACRYGGEEFLLLLPEASLEITRQRAQRLCDEIRHMHVRYRGQILGSITLSLGVAGFPEHGQLAADVVRAADTALYHAKHAGRNQVAVAEET